MTDIVEVIRGRVEGAPPEAVGELRSRWRELALADHAWRRASEIYAEACSRRVALIVEIEKALEAARLAAAQSACKMAVK